MFQLRQSQDGRAYRPARDIAYLFRHICQESFVRLAEHAWHPAIREYADFVGATQADFVKAAEAMADFIALASNSDVSFAAAWENSGMAKLKHPVLLMVMFQIGAGTTQAFFNAVHEVTQLGHSTPGLAAMNQVIEKAGHAFKSDSDRRRQAGAADASSTITSFDEFEKT